MGVDSTKVWIYQSDRRLTSDEQTFIQNNLNQFVTQWKSHGTDVNGTGLILHHRFIVLMVDVASGCSIDKSVHFIKNIGSNINADFFNRMLITYIDKDGNHQTVELHELESKYKQLEIDDETLFFDVLVQSKKEFETGFKKNIGNSWLKSRLT
jgi:hypothetical protein